MKKTLVIMYTMAICAIVVVACNKQTSQPEEKTTPTANETFQRKTLEIVRGRVSSTAAVTMNIQPVGNEVQVTTSSSVALSTDHYALFSPATDVTIVSGDAYLTVNSQKWWLVPFDTTKQPIEMTGSATGPSVQINCACSDPNHAGCSTAACEAATTGGATYCKPAANSCCPECEISSCSYRVNINSPWVQETNVSYRLVNTDNLRFNGVLYPILEAGE